MTLLNFQLVLGRRNIRPPHFASKVSYSASPQFFLDFAPNIAEQKNAMSAQMFRSIYHLFKRPLVYVPFLRTLPLLSYSVKAPSRSPSL